ncbi:MAG: hypothetical protein RR400_03385 [Clostridia bacterium]
MSFGAVFAEEKQDKIEIIYNTANVFEQADVSSKVLKTVKHEEQFQLFVQTEVVGIGGNFFHIKIDDKQNGFVLSRCALVLNDKSIINKISPNAVILDSVKEIQLFEFETDGKFSAFVTIQKTPDCKIRIIDGYNEHSEWTKIQLQNNQNTWTGYIKTQQINPYGIKHSIKITIIILTVVAIVLISLLIWFIKKKKTR